VFYTLKLTGMWQLAAQCGQHAELPLHWGSPGTHMHRRAVKQVLSCVLACVLPSQVFLRQSKALFPDINAPTGFRSEDEWVLDTEGVNLMGVSAGQPWCVCQTLRVFSGPGLTYTPVSCDCAAS
jgi:hypothetical protein